MGAVITRQFCLSAFTLLWLPLWGCYMTPGTRISPPEDKRYSRSPWARRAREPSPQDPPARPLGSPRLFTGHLGGVRALLAEQSPR